MSSLLRLEQQQKRFLKIPFEFAYFSFFTLLFGTDMINTFTHSRSSLENHIRFQTKIAKVYIYTLVFRPRATKTVPFWATYTYMVYIKKYRRGLYISLIIKTRHQSNGCCFSFILLRRIVLENTFFWFLCFTREWYFVVRQHPRYPAPVLAQRQCRGTW